MNSAMITAKRLSLGFFIGLAFIFHRLVLRHPSAPTARRVLFPRPVRVQLLPSLRVDQEDEQPADNQCASASATVKRRRAGSGGRWTPPVQSIPDPHSHLAR